MKIPLFLTLGALSLGLLSAPAAGQVEVEVPVFMSKTTKNGTVLYRPIKSTFEVELVVRLYHMIDDQLVQLLDDEGGEWEETFVLTPGDKKNPLAPAEPTVKEPGEIESVDTRIQGPQSITLGSTDDLPSDLNAATTFITTQVVDWGPKRIDFEESPARPLGRVTAPNRNNVIGADASTIGGGENNTIREQFAYYDYYQTGPQGGRGHTIAGGVNNIAGGYYGTYYGEPVQAGYATVGGGGGVGVYGEDFGNHATAPWATVGGGGRNRAAGIGSTVSGGIYNYAYSVSATVAGGTHNKAKADYSFAAGRGAVAEHAGAFVWGDSQVGTKHSVSADSFTVFARGGSRFFSDVAGTVGVGLAPGSGTWSTLSDRDSKTDVEPVDARAVLDDVLALPIATWRYKTQEEDVRHMGPMAQDFRAAFGLGVNDRLIDAVDPDGVALAAIQGLHQVVQERDAEIAQLQGELASLRAMVEALAAER